jgi:adenosylmethionine-8-amino-7-oxononanoate aminotransferase
MSEKVYAGIAEGAGSAVIGHGQTYSAHPVSAAIAMEVLRLYHEGGFLANGIAQAPRFEQGLQDLRQHPLVGDARQRGLLGALELVADKATKRRFDPVLGLSERITQVAYRNGIIFRAFQDNVLGFAPALCFSAEDFDVLFERLERTLDEVLDQLDVRAAVA